MKRKAAFEHETSIVIQGRRAEDIIWIIMGAAFVGLEIWGLAESWFNRTKLDEIFLAFALATPIGAVALIGPIIRAHDRRPYFQADREGLRLHAGFWPRPLPWADIRSLSIRTDPFAGGGALARNGMIRILLRHPQRTAAYPFCTREIRVPLRMLGLSRKQAADLLRRLKEIRAEDERRLTYRDPDAAG